VNRIYPVERIAAVRDSDFRLGAWLSSPSAKTQRAVERREPALHRALPAWRSSLAERLVSYQGLRKCCPMLVGVGEGELLRCVRAYRRGLHREYRGWGVGPLLRDEDLGELAETREHLMVDRHWLPALRELRGREPKLAEELDDLRRAPAVLMTLGKRPLRPLDAECAGRVLSAYCAAIVSILPRAWDREFGRVLTEGAGSPPREAGPEKAEEAT